MKIAIATDHNGVNEKKEIIKLLSEYDFLDKSVDFEEAVEVTKEMLEDQIKKIPESKKLMIRLR